MNAFVNCRFTGHWILNGIVVALWVTVLTLTNIVYVYFSALLLDWFCDIKPPKYVKKLWGFEILNKLCRLNTKTVIMKIWLFQMRQLSFMFLVKKWRVWVWLAVWRVRIMMSMIIMRCLCWPQAWMTVKKLSLGISYGPSLLVYV